MPRRIAILLDRENFHERRFFEGVQSYAQQLTKWHTLTDETIMGLPLEDLKRWRGDGIIGFLRERSLVQAVRRAHIPAVNGSLSGMALGVPTVIHDYVRGGRMAANHLLRRGFRNFGYFTDLEWSDDDTQEVHLLEKGFIERLAAKGMSCSVCTQPDSLPDGEHWVQYRQQLIDWLRQLPKPTAVFARHDRFAARVLAACEIAHLPVPDEVAVMGWDDDEIICPFTTPPLTSIPTVWREVGYRAAELLDQLMNGQEAPNAPVLVRPKEIAERQSTDFLALEDPLVAKAVQYIEKHACTPATVGDVANHVAINRRRLERLFQKALHRSPNTEIIRMRMRRARHLLGETDMPMAEIARACGYPNQKCLGIAFRREVGVAPTVFRRNSRAKSNRALA